MLRRKMRIYVIIQALLLSSYVNASQIKPIVCDQTYALCTSAPCIPDPRHPGYAMCVCDVENGESAGYKTCEQRLPKQNNLNTTKLVSTFSFEQFKTKKSMNCEKGMPWTNCVDAPCIVDPLHPLQAICSCEINHSQAFLTFGGNCDTRTCATGFWSGTTVSTGTELREAMIEKLHLAKDIWRNNFCAK